MGNLGDAAFSRGDVVRRIDALEARLREAIAGRRLENATVGAGGILIKDGGSLFALDTDGVIVIALGRNTEAGTDFEQLWVGRPDNSPMLSTHIDRVTGGKFLAITDKDSNRIFAEDARNGGIALPHLPIALQAWPGDGFALGTGSTAFQLSARCAFEKWQPYFSVVSGDYSSNGNEPEFQIRLDGTTVATFPYSAFQFGPWPIPGALQSVHYMEVYVRMTGTPPAGSRVYGQLDLQQTQTPD